MIGSSMYRIAAQLHSGVHHGRRIGAVGQLRAPQGRRKILHIDHGKLKTPYKSTRYMNGTKMLYLVDLIHPDGYHEISAHRDPVQPLLSGCACRPITLTGTVRDFNADGVNFEGSGGSGTGYVNTTLSGSSPTLTALGSSQISNSGPGHSAIGTPRPPTACLIR